MKYAPHLYAQAFRRALTEAATPLQKNSIVERFATLLIRNGDIRRHDVILVAVERELVRAAHGRHITIETARQVPKELAGAMRSFATERDVVEERIVPALMAGARIIIDGEREFDGSLKRKLEILWPTK